MKVIHNPTLPITKPGIYTGISLEDYHSDRITDGPSVSSSGLRTMWSHSPKAFFSEWAFNPKREPFEPSRPMIKGSAAHHLLLGEDAFSKHYIGRPEFYMAPGKTTGRGKEKVEHPAEKKPWNSNSEICKEWLAEQKTLGRTVVLQTELADIVAMARELSVEPLVQSGALNGMIECSMFAKDPETGLWLRIRPDAVPNDGDYTDLKITADVTDLAVWRMLKSFGYQMQGGLNWMVAELLGLPFTSFTLMLCEATSPYSVRPVVLEDEDLGRGRLQCRAMINKVASCMASGIWPGPGAGETRPFPLSPTEREYIDKRLARIADGKE